MEEEEHKEQEEQRIKDLLDSYLLGACVPLSSDIFIKEKFNPDLRSINNTIYSKHGGVDSLEVLNKLDEIYRIVWKLDNYSNIGTLYDFIESLKSDKDHVKLNFVIIIMKIKGANPIVKQELDELRKTLKIKSETRVVFKSLAEAAANEDRLNEMYSILLSKGMINSDHTIRKRQGISATLLYSYIKRFNELGYFKKITGIELHSLVNATFKMTEVHQLYKQAPVYSKDLY